ncbi:MAG: hypothetical protein NTY99_03275 [DPANN group archaeon]|nr:hypothetical protein [DPANN group archaeon]
MQIVTGFVCLAKRDLNPPDEVLFGKNIKNRRNFQCFEEALMPYDTLRDVKKAIPFIKKAPYVLSAIPAKIEMRIAARNIEEMDSLRDEKSLIVIAKNASLPNYVEYWLLGPIVEGRPNFSPIGCAHLRDNGYKVFEFYESAKLAVYEMERQGGLPSQIATFSLEEIMS